MEFAITKMSTKGQIVIPSTLREEFQVGEEFLVVKEKNNLVLKRVKDLAKDFVDDLQFAEAIERSWKDYDQGKFKTRTKEAFLRELEKW